MMIIYGILRFLKMVFPFFPLHCQTSHQRPGILAISGSEARTRRRFAAPSGRQITGMQFDNHQLMGVFLENLGLDLEKMYRWVYDSVIDFTDI